MIRHIVKWNFAICDGVERTLPGKFTRSLLYLHELTAARLMNARPSQVVADIGGGHLCPFGRHRRRELGTTIVGVDILESQLRGNPIIDHAVVADASRALPFGDASLDLIVTRSVIEHLHDNEMFFAETSRVLRPGGHAIHVFPGRFAPFALLNRVLPALPVSPNSASARSRQSAPWTRSRKDSTRFADCSSTDRHSA